MPRATSSSTTNPPRSSSAGRLPRPGRCRPIHLLLTHLHLDHIEGLGFFAPIWEEDAELHVWGPPSPRRSLSERIARYLSPPLFPIQLSSIPAQIHFHDVPDDAWQIGSA